MIDPVFEVRRDAALVGELDLRLLYDFKTHIHAEAMSRIDRIIAEHVVNPIGPEFMVPPAGPAMKAMV